MAKLNGYQRAHINSQEIKDMHGLRILNGLLLGAALIAPAALLADDTKSTTTNTTTRYYDSGGKDYHDWTPNEDRAYRMYLGEQHRDYVEFPKTTVVQQSEYFKWRHGHSDSVIKTEKTEEK
jgi:gas vesicle protein